MSAVRGEGRQNQLWRDPIALVCGAAAIAVLSFVLPPRWILVLQNILVLGLFAAATNLIVGYGGLISFGQAVFYGLGSYTLALGWLRFHAPFWLLMVLSPVVGAVASLVIGSLALRTRQFYFALLTLAFSQLFFTIANQWYSFTEGANGVFGAMIPAALAQPQHGLWFILVVSLVALLALWAITVSPFGLTLRAIRENPQRVQAIGVNLYRHQLYAFMVSGAFCSLAGALFVVHDQSAYPELLGWTASGESILMALIGGLHYFLGPLIGTIIYVFVHDYLVAHTHAWQLVLGAALVAIVLFAPNGLLGVWGSDHAAPLGVGRVRAALSRLMRGKP